MSRKTGTHTTAPMKASQVQNSPGKELRDFLVRTPYGILVVDRQGTVRFANQPAAAIFGCSVEQLIEDRCGLLPIPDNTPEATVKTRHGTSVFLEIQRVPAEWDGSPAMILHLQDITERKRVEEELRESEDKFAKAFQAVPALLSISSLADGRYIEVNEALAATLGYHRDEVIGRAAQQLGIWENPGDRDRLVRQLREGKRVRDFETRLRRKTGGVIVGSLSAEIISIKGEECLLALTRDITRIKQAEERLRKSGQQLAEAQRLAHLGSWEWNIGADRLTVSAELCGIFGLPPEGLDATYTGILKMVHPDDRENYEKVIQLAITDKTSYDNYHRIIRPDGTVRILASRGTVTVDTTGTPVSLFGTCQDVTERKQAEESLRETEQKLRLIVEHSTNLFYMHTADHILTYVSPQSWHFFDCAPEEAMGHWTELITDNPLNRTAMESTQRAIDSGERQPPYLVECIGRKGREIWVEVNEAPIVENGRTVAIAGSLTDITERKRAEERIEILNTDLMARAAELEAVNRELEAFGYTVSHDLRKPLTVINGYSQVILEMCGETMSEECSRYLMEICNGTLRMNSLIDTLLKFSHLTQVELKRETVDLSGLAQFIASGLKLTEPQRTATFIIAQGVACYGDADLLRVVLENLLGNAWKYTARNKDAVIEFGATEMVGDTAYFVRDNGAGFDMAHADKLFVPFQRLPGATRFKGHGIGLATVHRIIKRHGGRVWAEGEPGKGATFYFTLQ